jgi:hypothetical protein
MKVSWLWLTCVLVFLAAPAFAQVPVNPGRVELKADDLPIATRVEIGVFLLGAAAPVSVLDIGKPTPRPDGLIEAPVNVRPFGLGELRIQGARRRRDRRERLAGRRGRRQDAGPFRSCPQLTGPPQSSALNFARWAWFWEHCL